MMHKAWLASTCMNTPVLLKGKVVMSDNYMTLPRVMNLQYVPHVLGPEYNTV